MRHVGGISAGYHGLGGYASGVDASAAEQGALDDRDLHARSCQTARQGGAGLSCADDDGIEPGH